MNLSRFIDKQGFEFVKSEMKKDGHFERFKRELPDGKIEWLDLRADGKVNIYAYKDDEPAEISDKARRVKRQIRSIKDDKQTSLFDVGDIDG